MVWLVAEAGYGPWGHAGLLLRGRFGVRGDKILWEQPQSPLETPLHPRLGGLQQPSTPRCR